MVLHDSKDHFYKELAQKITTGEITSPEFVEFIRNNAAEEPEKNTSEFYELCAKFEDISLNSVKQVDSETCDVQAIFLYKDADAAKSAFHEYMKDHHLSDVDGVLEAIHLMHWLAVAWDDPRCTSGTVRPKDYNWQPGFAGKYYAFRMLPDDIWEKIKAEIKADIVQFGE